MADDSERNRRVTHPTDGEVEITLTYPRAGDVKKGFSMMLDIEKHSEDEGSAATIIADYLEHVDEMSARAIGRSVEWLDELTDEDKDKITSWYDERVKKREDFMKSSSRQVGS